MAEKFFSNGGSNGNPGTEGSPYLTLSYAVSQVSAGDTVTALAGTYTGSDNRIDDRVFTTPNNITVRAKPGQIVTLQPPNAELIHLESHHSFQVEDFIFDFVNITGALPGVYCSGSANTHHHVFRRCEAKNYLTSATVAGQVYGFGGGGFHQIIGGKIHHVGNPAALNNAYPIYSGCPDVLIDGVEIYNAAWYGIHIYDITPSNHRTVIRNCRIRDCGTGLLVAQGDDLLVYNNLIYRCGAGLVVYTAAVRAGLYNNTITEIAGAGITAEFYSAAAPPFLKNNILYACGQTIVDLSGTIPAVNISNNLEINPQFVDALNDDFRILATSPATDAGMTLLTVPYDFAGTPRPQGAAYDIGAYEVVAVGGGPGTFALVATTAADAVSYVDTGLTPSTRYWYQVRAVNASGNSAYSNQDDATTTAEAAIRNTQSLIEVLFASAETTLRTSQSFLEVIYNQVIAGELRATQSLLEVIVEQVKGPGAPPVAAEAHPLAVVELGLGGSFDALIRGFHDRDVGTGRYWRLGDVRTTRARDDFGAGVEWMRSPSTDGIYVGSPEPGRGLLPAYGLATAFNGATQAVRIDTGLGGTSSPFSIVALIRVAKPIGGTSRTVIHTGTNAAWIGLDGSGVVGFGLYGGTQVTASIHLHVGEQALIVATYDGSNARLYVVSLEEDASPATPAIVDVAGPTAITWGAAHDTTQARIGALAGTTAAQYFHGEIQNVALFDLTVLSLSDVEALAAAAVWTDVSDDVHYPIIWDRGLHSDRPDTRWARTGTLTFALDNSHLNSLGLEGAYTPGHVNARAGFDRGIPCRVVQLVGTTQTRVIRFIGTIKTLQITPGAYLQRDVPVLVTDWLDEAAKASVQAVATEQQVTADAVLARLIDQMDLRPHALDLGAATDVYPVALHTLDETSTVQSEAIKVVTSEQGLGYVRGDGTFVFEPRAVRQAASGIDATLAEIRTADPERSGLHILNRVKATVHPRRIDETADVELYSTFGESGSPAAGQPHTIDHGVPVSIFLPYTDPTGQAERVAGVDLQTPTPNVDIFINSHPDGTGADLIADPTIVYTITNGGSGAYLDITNTWGQRVYLALRLFGRGIYDYAPVQVRSEDRASIRRDGLQELTIDLPYLDNPSTAQAIADYLRLSSLEAPTRLTTVSYKMYGPDLITLGVNTDISSRLLIQETMSATDRVFVVNGEQVTWREGDDVDVEYWLTATRVTSDGDPEAPAVWVLEASDLEVNTILAA